MHASHPVDKRHWAFKDGREARRVGRSIDSCFLPAGTYAASCWREGWLAEDRDRRTAA